MEGWEQHKIKDIVHPLTTVDPRKAPAAEFEYIDVSSVSRTTHQVHETTRLLGADAPSRARRKVQCGDVLFAIIRPTLQRITIIPDDLDGAICSTGYYVLRPRDQVHSSFLFYYLFGDAFSSEMKSLQRGAAYPAVSDKDVKEHLIPLPPLPEQERIVAILDEAFAAIATATANAEKNLANARELFESQLARAFSGGDSGDVVMEGWEQTTLGDLCEFRRGLTYKKADEVDVSRNAVLRANNITVETGEINFDEIRYIREDIEIPDKKKLVPGSLLVCTASGSKKHLGKIGIVTEDIDFAFGGFMALLLPQEQADAKYLFWHTRSSFYRDFISDLSDGVNINNLKWSQLSELPVPLPPIAEQGRIVAILDEASAQSRQLEQINTNKLDLLTNLKQSLLHKAFTGELTADKKAADRTLSEAAV